MLYVNRITISGNGKLECVTEPSLEVIMQALQNMEEGKADLIEIDNTNKDVGITIFGEPGVYHIGIINSYNDEIYYYWNGMDLMEELIGIAGNVFPKYMVCNDFTVCSTIVEEFCKSGERSNRVKWILDDDVPRG